MCRETVARGWGGAQFQTGMGFDGGARFKYDHAPKSVGIATGFLIAAVYHAGLVCLTHTVAKMKFLNGLLGRPALETQPSRDKGRARSRVGATDRGDRYFMAPRCDEERRRNAPSRGEVGRGPC